MKRPTVIKFKAELNKYFGIVLCTPLCGIIFNLLVFDSNKIDTIAIRLIISGVLAAVGISYIIKAVEILEKENAYNHKLLE